MTEPVQNHPDETPYYPLLLLVVESKSYYLLPIPMVMHAEKNPQDMLQAFADSWKKQNMYPKEIRCRDERTYALLKDFCEKTNVKVSIYEDEMLALDDVEYHLLSEMSDPDEEEMIDEMEETIEALLAMSPAELKMMPEPMIEQLRMLLTTGAFPDELAEELLDKLDW